jgi:hypothetical protein
MVWDVLRCMCACMCDSQYVMSEYEAFMWCVCICVCLYTTWPEVCGHLLVEHLIPTSWTLICCWSHLCCYNSFPSSGCGDLLPFSHKSISEVGHWCFAIRAGLQSTFQCIPNLFDVVKVRALCRSVKFFHTPISTNHFCMDLALCMGELSCWNRTGPSPNHCHKFGSTESPTMSLHVVALRFPFTGTKWPKPEPWKTALPLFLFHQTLPLALCIGAGNVLPASAKPRLVRLTARWWSVIHHSRECISTAPESNGGELYTTPANNWHCAWWS